MYTATLKSKTFNERARRLELLVTIDPGDGSPQYDQQFSFAPNTSVQSIRKTVQRFIDEQEMGRTLDSSFEVGVSITYTPDPDPEPTAAELAEREWRKDRETLREVMELVRDGVLNADDQQVVNLQNKVRINLDPSYVV